MVFFVEKVFRVFDASWLLLPAYIGKSCFLHRFIKCNTCILLTLTWHWRVGWLFDWLSTHWRIRILIFVVEDLSGSIYMSLILSLNLHYFGSFHLLLPDSLFFSLFSLFHLVKHRYHDRVDLFFKKHDPDFLFFPKHFEISNIVICGGDNMKLSIFEEIHRLNFLLKPLNFSSRVMVKISKIFWHII